MITNRDHCSNRAISAKVRPALSQADAPTREAESRNLLIY
jgi:hypothetical protein